MVGMVGMVGMVQKVRRARYQSTQNFCIALLCALRP